MRTKLTAAALALALLTAGCGDDTPAAATPEPTRAAVAVGESCLRPGTRVVELGTPLYCVSVDGRATWQTSTPPPAAAAAEAPVIVGGACVAVGASAATAAGTKVECVSDGGRLTWTDPAPPTPEAKPTIEEGVWTVGVDVPPGTYRVTAPVDDGCYWAITKSGSNGENIIANDIVSGGRPTVTLKKGQDFESARCGTWEKVK